MNITKQTGSKNLQYAFILDQRQNIIPCDSCSEDFLNSIDLGNFFSHIQCLHINELSVTSTIILNNASYGLHILPFTPALSENHKAFRFLEGCSIIFLQDQSLLSELLQLLNKSSDVTSFEQFFNRLNNGIFITNADSSILYCNERYEEVSGVKAEAIIGDSIYELNAKGYFSPLLLPTILKENDDYAVLQHYRSGHFGFVYGTPIYNSVGLASMVLICVTPILREQIDEITKIVSTATSDNHIYNLSKSNQSLQIDLIAESSHMKRMIQDITKASRFDVPILLLGESGTGKEIFAEVIHATSSRLHKPFVKINCSAIPPSLLDAELFGYEPNAFTGASSKGHSGFFETANGGTILLDEIGDMPLEAQAKILRVLQTGEIYKVGSSSPLKVNVRIIAATNKDIPEMISQGLFRMDLYFRLNVIVFNLLPLRKHPQDIEPLLYHYCHLFNKKYQTNKQLSPKLLEYLSAYDWPGNIRELRNAVERMVIICVNDVLTPEDFPAENDVLTRFAASDSKSFKDGPVLIDGIPNLNEAVRLTETICVSRAMEKTGNTRKAAELLGVSQSTVMRKIKENNITFNKQPE